MGNKIKRNIVSVTKEEDLLFKVTCLTGRNTACCWQPHPCSFQGQNSKQSIYRF